MKIISEKQYQQFINLLTDLGFTEFYAGPKMSIDEIKNRRYGKQNNTEVLNEK